MNISVITHADGFQYLCLSDFAKEYQKRYFKKFNLSQSVKNIPDRYLIISQGRNGKTYINTSIIDMFFNTKRNIPIDIINEVNLIVKNSTSAKINNMELFFVDLVTSFLSDMIPNLEIIHQKTIKNKTFDLCINNKILIEFDEYDHKYRQENDSLKNEIASDNGYTLIRVNSNSCYGYELSRIYKTVKNKLL